MIPLPSRFPVSLLPFSNRRPSFCGLACFAFLTALSLAASSPAKAAEAPAALELRVEPYRFEARDGRAVDAEVGRFRVRENRRAGGEKTVELAFVRFKSTAAKPGPPIVYLAGGPGGSGSGTAQGTRFDLFLALREFGDVIAFDQRGTGLSDRLPACSKGWSVPLEQAASRAELEAAVEEAARFCAEEWRAQGVDLDAYNSEESADDLEDLRLALGAEKLRLWSISYGTHLALAALRRHPGSFDRVILAGLEGPDHTVKLPADSQALLEEIASRVAADPGAAKAFPTFLEDVKSVLATLSETPAKIAVTTAEGKKVQMAVTAFDVQMLAAGALRGPESMMFLPGAFKAMKAGNFDLLARFLPRGRSGEIYPMSAAMDAASGISPERRALVARQAGTTLLSDAINFPWGATVRGLGVRDLGAAFRAPLESSVPALFISGTLDGRTPVGNAQELLPGFSRASHLILEGAGHSDPLFLSSTKILETMKKFLAGETLPKEMRIEVEVPGFLGAS